MKNILVIGAAGQIGSEMVPALRARGLNVVAAGSGKTPLPDHLSDGPCTTVNLLDFQQLKQVVEFYNIDTVFNLAAILSAKAEQSPLLAWDIGVNGLIGLLELAREKHLRVFTPSSIGVFGPETPLELTPQDTVCRPKTIYGITKVADELLSDYYRFKYGVDTRSLRYPGLISYVTPPGGGTTDYAVDIYWQAVKTGHYSCPLQKGTKLPMMFMPDALRAAIELMSADATALKHFNAFNVQAMTFAPEDIAASIRKYVPDFVIEYHPNPVLQNIAQNWPDALDDTQARQQWGWKPQYDLDSMTAIMLEKIKAALKNSATTSLSDHSRQL